MDKTGTVTVTGAGGFVGGRLAVALAERGRTVRPLTRTSGDVADRAWPARGTSRKRSAAARASSAFAG